MTATQSCTYTKDNLVCPQPAALGSDRCELHPYEEGDQVTPSNPPPSDPLGGWLRGIIKGIKYAVITDRVIEVSEEIVQILGDLFSANLASIGRLSEDQLRAVHSIIHATDPAEQSTALTELFASASEDQRIALVSILTLAVATLGIRTHQRRPIDA